MKKILFLAMMIALFVSPVVGFANNTGRNAVKLDDFEITTPEKEETLVTPLSRRPKRDRKRWV